MSILNLATEPGSVQITAIEKGLPSSALNGIARMLGLPKVLIITSLRLVPRTITAREKAKQRFSLEESERLLRILRVHKIVREVFTSDHAVAEWLNTPDPSLNDKPPLNMLTTGIGASKVENLALAMIHGVPL